MFLNFNLLLSWNFVQESILYLITVYLEFILIYLLQESYATSGVFKTEDVRPILYNGEEGFCVRSTEKTHQYRVFVELYLLCYNCTFIWQLSTFLNNKSGLCRILYLCNKTMPVISISYAGRIVSLRIIIYTSICRVNISIVNFLSFPYWYRVPRGM